jgi:putative DNA primase/helicase
MTDPTQEFRQTLQAAGLTPPDTLIPGKLHRFPSNGKRSDTAGWCKLFPDGLGGTYGDFRSGLSETWQSRANERMTKEERDAFRRQMEQARRERDAEEEKLHLEAMPGFLRLWNQSRQDVDLTHAYLAVKGGIRPFGIRQLGQALIVPVWGADKALHGLQFIQPDGSKKFKVGTRKAGSWCVLKPEGIPPTDWTAILIAEGWATAASLHTATGHPVFIAFDCGNLSAVAQYIRQQFPAARLLFCADDDAHGKGLHHAQIAARQTGGMTIIPQWGGIDMSHERLTDFNDLDRAVGLDAVRHQIGNALENFTTEPSRPANDALEPDEGEEIEVHRNAPRGTPAMLYGIFGEIGRIAADGTEANPYAACMNAMVFFSACVGREVFFRIGNGTHHARLFALHVGRSSVGRKGTAMDLLWRIIGEMDRQERTGNGGMIADDSRLLPKVHTGGLSSREGVTHYLHDGILQGETSIPPVHDKRLLVVESEFVNVLSQAGRQGNTLSAAIRDLYDGKKIMPLTKNPVGASSPHVAIYGNITAAELLATLTKTDRDNGFVNRFIIFHAEMSRLEPFPRATPAAVVSDLARRLLEITAFAKGGYVWDANPELASMDKREMTLSREARALYASLYLGELNSQKDGPHVSGMMHRGPANLMRMAMVFTLSDLSETIEPRHLEAAMAWVRYWRESVKFIFNDAQEEAEQVKTSDKAERLYQWLKTRNKPTTRTEITNECFSKRGGSDVDKAIDTLLRDTPPRIEVIEGEKSTNGKRTKFYTACGLGGTGGVDCSATASPTPHGCGLGGAGFKSDTVNNQSRNPSPPTPQACGLAESIAAQSIPPSPPTPQGLNENDDAEVEL